MKKSVTYISAGLVAVFVLYLAVIYGICYRAPGYGLFRDDGIYMVTAKSLAEGTGYRIISAPSAIRQNRYPPVFPVLLASVWRIFPHFPQNILVLRLVPLLSMLGWLWLTYILLRRISESATASRCIILLTAATPVVVYFSVTLLSEMTFACLLSGALLLLMRLHEEETSRVTTVLWASVLSAAAILTRMAGLPLVFAGALALLLRRKTWQALTYFLSTGIMLLPWFLWAWHAKRSLNSIEVLYDPDLAWYGRAYGDWSGLAGLTWHQRTNVVLHNLGFILASPGYLIGARPFGVGLVLWMLLGFFTVYGFLLDLSKGTTPLNLFLLFYAALLLLWLFPPFRFLVPLFPFLLFFCYAGINHFVGTVIGSPAGARVVGQCCAVFLALFLMHGLFLEARKTTQYQVATLPDQENNDWNEITALSRWISGNTPEDAILAGNMDPIWFLSTGRKAVWGFIPHPYELIYSANPQDPLGTYSEFVQNLVRVRADYLMRTSDRQYSGGNDRNNMIDRFASEYRGAVTLEMLGQDSEYRIYRIDRVKLTSEMAMAH